MAFRNRSGTEDAGAVARPKAKRIRMPLPATVLVVVVLATFAASSAWRLAGNSFFFVATPSMCPSLCVGSLAIDVPASGHSLHVGDTITFHPPGVSQPFTHRIVKISDNGRAISTKGTASSQPDPWTITPVDVEGVMVASAWGLGWFYRALPFMTIGVLILLLSRRFVPPRDRRDTDRLISILLVAIPVAVVKPLLSAYTVSVTTTKRAGIGLVRIINTGLLPGKFAAEGGQSVSHVAPGRSITLTGPTVSGVGVPYRVTASFYWTGWVIVAVALLAPAINFGYDVVRHHYQELDRLDDEAPFGDRPDSIESLEPALVDGATLEAMPSDHRSPTASRSGVYLLEPTAPCATPRSKSAPVAPTAPRTIRVKGGFPH
jgi:signal peptidase I